MLQEVQVPIMENHVCQEMFRTAGHNKLILESFLCAGYANGQKDSCEVSIRVDKLKLKKKLFLLFRASIVGRISHFHLFLPNYSKFPLNSSLHALCSQYSSLYFSSSLIYIFNSSTSPEFLTSTLLIFLFLFLILPDIPCLLGLPFSFLHFKLIFLIPQLLLNS